MIYLEGFLNFLKKKKPLDVDVDVLGSMLQELEDESNIEFESKYGRYKNGLYYEITTGGREDYLNRLKNSECYKDFVKSLETKYIVESPYKSGGMDLSGSFQKLSDSIQGKIIMKLTLKK